MFSQKMSGPIAFVSSFADPLQLVTEVEFLPNVVPVEDEEVSKQLARSFKKAGIKVMTDSSVESVDTSGATCKVKVKTKKGIESMAKGFDNILKRFGVDSVEAIDNLSDEAKTKLNISLKAAYGLELGEFISTVESMKEAGKGMSERLDEINKKRKLNCEVLMLI